jgi:ATP-dependent RNA/DNA helicase IGHMBP2
MDYFKRLQDLLKMEEEVDRRSYRELSEVLSVSERRAGGLTWYPIVIKDTEMSRGDYLTVEVERPTHQDIVHQLRFGASAALFSGHDSKTDRVEGIIVYQSGNRLKLTLRTDELPDWSRDGKLGIDLLFDDNSYEEMKNALRLASVRGEKKEEGRLIKVLTGERSPAFPPDERSPGFPPDTLRYVNPRLNASQNMAVERILCAGDLAIVHGPPGTGKTTTLVQAIRAMIERDYRQVLVVAPSNAAVDLLSEKLSDEGLNVLRVGNPARVSERLMSLTLDARMMEHSRMKEMKKLRKQAAEYRNMAHKYKRNFGKAERDQRKALLDEARNIMKEVENTEQYIIQDLVSRAQVITATLVGSNHYTVRNGRYGTVVIDEAGQALEPACWIPILKADKVVLAGDHCQLPPTVKSAKSAQPSVFPTARSGEAAGDLRTGNNGAGDLRITLLEKCIALHPESVVLLEEQYRMNELIMGYSSSVFYGDKLRAHASVAGHVLFAGDRPLAFVDTAGCGFEEKSEGTSTTNPEEAALLFKHLAGLVQELGAYYQPKDFPTIAVISPYKQQVEVLKDQLRHAPFLDAYADKISVNTIDSFQGQERDIVYISMTRSNGENQIGFLSDIRRMNVAMTRARKKLVVVGDSGTLSQLPFYANFIAYADQREAYQSAWEWFSAGGLL